MAFKGYVDILENTAYTFDSQRTTKRRISPQRWRGMSEDLREALVENAACNDEALMEKFFEGEELSKEDILNGTSFWALNLWMSFPCLPSSATQNLGVKELADALAAYMPAADKAKPPVHAVNEKGEDVEITCSAEGHFAAQVLKTIADPFVGRISLIKVLRGVFEAGYARLSMCAQARAEKFGNISIMRGKKLINVDAVSRRAISAPWQSCNLPRRAIASASAADKLTFDALEFGEPCICLAVTAKKQGEEEKVFAGLHRLEEEDPTFRIEQECRNRRHAGLCGMGEMHIEVICQKLKNKFGVEAALSDPKVAYRETIRKSAEAEGKHKKQSGGAGQFGVVQIRFEPIYGRFYRL